MGGYHNPWLVQQADEWEKGGDVPTEAGQQSNRQNYEARIVSWAGSLVEGKGDMLLYHQRRHSPMVVTGAGRVLEKLGQPNVPRSRWCYTK